MAKMSDKKIDEILNDYDVPFVPIEDCPKGGTCLPKRIQSLIQQAKNETIAKLRKEIEGKKKYDFCPDELGNGMGYLNESDDGVYVKVSDINEILDKESEQGGKDV